MDVGSLHVIIQCPVTVYFYKPGTGLDAGRTRLLIFKRLMLLGHYRLH